MGCLPLAVTTHFCLTRGSQLQRHLAERNAIWQDFVSMRLYPLLCYLSCRLVQNRFFSQFWTNENFIFLFQLLKLRKIWGKNLGKQIWLFGDFDKKIIISLTIQFRNHKTWFVNNDWSKKKAWRFSSITSLSQVFQ